MHKANFKHFLIIAKTGHTKAKAFAKEIEAHFKAQGKAATICQAEDLAKLPLVPKPDLTIVLGGDGTMLGVGRLLAGQNIPMLGINFGQVGFLTIAKQDNWLSTVEACLSGLIPLQPRLCLKWQIKRGEKCLKFGQAVNDVVIGHGPLARLISVNLQINAETLGLLRCDGIILASPLGTSGYTASAGGPIVHAQTDALVITPICPFLRSIAPMVFPPKVVIRASLEDNSSQCFLTVDGQEVYPLEPSDLVEVKGEPQALYFFGRDEIFLERLRTRGLTIEKTYEQKRPKQF
ncbi:MAG: NAD(+)/NADH kinase [Desulfovibrio sp.]|nr:NAD(+)/NADH kinase [Desulfovibrio sp.]